MVHSSDSEDDPDYNFEELDMGDDDSLVNMDSIADNESIHIEEQDVQSYKVGVVYGAMKYPFLLVMAVIILVELLVYTIVRLLVFFWEATTENNRDLRKALRAASTYKEWRRAAKELDNVSSMAQCHSNAFDRELIRSFTSRLYEAIEYAKTSCEAPAVRYKLLVDTLRQVCVPNLGGAFENEEVYSYNYRGYSKTLKTFVNASVSGLEMLRDSELGSEEKIHIFESLDLSYGHTALCLSGGAGNGYYHLGVVKALLERNLLPHIISGSSAGSLIGALVCTRTDEELRQELVPELADMLTACEEPVWKWATRWWRTGAIFSPDDWFTRLHTLLKGDITFREAYLRSGRVLNITAFDGARNTVVLNYRNAPDVLVSSAVMASSCIPNVLPPVELKVKQACGTLKPDHSLGRVWKDGSFAKDLPVQLLHQTFGVNFTLVSQVEPHIVPFFYNREGCAGMPCKHRSGRGWRGGFFMSYLENFLKLDMVKWLVLCRDFKLVPCFFGVDWSSLFLQEFVGSMAILPRLRLADYFNLLTDPDRKGLESYLVNGQRSTWPKITMLHNRMAITKTIRSCLHALDGVRGRRRSSIAQMSPMNVSYWARPAGSHQVVEQAELYGEEVLGKGVTPQRGTHWNRRSGDLAGAGGRVGGWASRGRRMYGGSWGRGLSRAGEQELAAAPSTSRRFGVGKYGVQPPPQQKQKQQSGRTPPPYEPSSGAAGWGNEPNFEMSRLSVGGLMDSSGSARRRAVWGLPSLAAR